jgi:serine/threonine protein kinase
MTCDFLDLGKNFVVSDPIRSIIQTQHPRLAEEVRDAISVMEKVLQLAGESTPQARPDRAQSSDYEILATRDTQASTDSAIGATVDTQQIPKGRIVSQIVRLSAGEAFGRYQIVNLLGEGAMGAVYLAYDPTLQRHVAIKIPTVQNSVALERFYIEARATATLRTPNICPVYDVGQISGVHFISMAFIDGRPLSKAIADAPMSVEQASTILSKTARGIQKAHERGVIHRDLKPDNIMIDVDGEPVVMDFGLAVRQDDGDARITKAGALVGSPAYMSPEQAEGKQDLIGPATDIYSLGVVLYQMLTQRLPFEGSIMAVLRQIT